MKLIVRFTLVSILTLLSLDSASAGSDDWIAKAKDLQATYIKMTNDKYLPCFTLSAPAIPDFTDKDDVNKELFNEFEKNMINWMAGIEKIIIEKCRPQPQSINWDNEVSNAISNFYTKLKAMVPSFCVEVSLTRPKFTGDQVKDGEIYNEWMKTTFNNWTNQMISDNKMKCIPQNQDLSPERIESIENFKKLVQEAQAFYFGLVSNVIQSKFGIGSYRWIVTTPQPSYDDYNYPTLEKFGIYKNILAKWADNEIINLRIENFSGQLIDSKDPKNAEICQAKLKEKSLALDPRFRAYNSYSEIWNNNNKLQQSIKDKYGNVSKAYEDYYKLILSEMDSLKSIWQTYDIDGNLKVICSLTNQDLYNSWTYIESLRTNLIQQFNDLLQTILQISKSMQEQEKANDSYDDPAVFNDQVNFYYMKYVTSQIDQLKAMGINFSFMSIPPSKPLWTNTKNGSNAKLVNDFISAMSKWWSIEGPRITEAFWAFEAKDIQNWVKNGQLDASNLVIRAAFEKFGFSGTYKFINPIPVPSQSLINNPTKSLMEKFQDELYQWAAIEIDNLEIENYTYVNDGELEAKIKICQSTIDRANTYFGRFDSQISYLSNVWSNYNQLLEVLKTKNLTMLSYRIQIDRALQNPYLSDLYDVVQLLASVKPQCGASNGTSKSWSETYLRIDKEIQKLRNFSDLISNYFDKYRFTEPKLIPEIGKVTQIVGGCQVQIMNYDPSFRWWAKGDMVVDINGLATITNGSIDQYLSTEKVGYQLVNHLDGMFKCAGIPKLASNVIDVKAPVMSLVSVSRQELYKGQSVLVTVLITDNKEVNSFKISLMDQIGQDFPCFDGVAWKARTQGNENVGVYSVECWVRTVSYDGIWKITGAAQDLNSNSASFELTKIKILYGTAPSASELIQPENLNDSTKNRIIGSPELVNKAIKDQVENSKEEKLMLDSLQKISTIPKSTKSTSVSTLASIKGQINVVIETPKVCRYQNGVIRRISKGVCSKTIELIDSEGNQYLVTQQIRFR